MLLNRLRLSLPSLFTPDNLDTALIFASFAFIYFSTSYLRSNFHRLLQTSDLYPEEEQESTSAHREPFSKKRQKTEELIPISALTSLSQSPVQEIRDAAIALIEARYHRHPYTRRHIVSALSQSASETERATALRILLTSPSWRRREIEDALPSAGDQHATFRSLNETAVSDVAHEIASGPRSLVPRVQILATDEGGNSAVVFEGDASNHEMLMAILSEGAGDSWRDGRLRPYQRMGVEEMEEQARQAENEQAPPPGDNSPVTSNAHNWLAGPMRITVNEREILARNVQRDEHGEIIGYDLVDEAEAATDGVDGERSMAPRRRRSSMATALQQARVLVGESDNEDVDGERSSARPRRRSSRLDSARDFYIRDLDGDRNSASRRQPARMEILEDDAVADFDGERSSARRRRRRPRQVEILQPRGTDTSDSDASSTDQSDEEGQRWRRREAMAIIDMNEPIDHRTESVESMASLLSEAGAPLSRQIARSIETPRPDEEDEEVEDAEEMCELRRY